MNADAAASPLQRIVETATRRNLDTPFRSNASLRSRHFPGAGRQITRTRLKSNITCAVRP